MKTHRQLKHDRDFAARLFPWARETIMDPDACYPAIVGDVAREREQALSAIEGIEIPSEWAYYWAYHIGDRDVMRDRVTDSRWADVFARDFRDLDFRR